MKSGFDLSQEARLHQDLIEAQSIAKLGSWRLSLIDHSFSCSAEHFRIFEIADTNSQNTLFDVSLQKVHPDDFPLLLRNIESANRKGTDFSVHIRLLLDEGRRTKYIHTIGKVVKNETGQPVFVNGTNQDVTEATLQQNILKQSLDFNNAILRSAKFSIITTTVDGVIIGFNDEASRMLGYEAEELVGKETPAIIHDAEEVANVAAVLSKELGTQVPVGFETFIYKARMGLFDERQWTYIRKDGSRLQVRLNITALFNANNELYGFMGIARDLTNEISIQAELENERAKSIHSSKLASLGEMSAGIAHEINNPLAIISGNVRLLKRYRLDEEKFVNKVEAIEKSIARIEKIVGGLRKFSRTTGGTPFRKVSLKRIVGEAFVLVDSKAKRHETDLSFEVPEGLEIECDEVEIEQVLVNLINNSIDAIKHLESRWVKIIGFRESSLVILRVFDSGRGIHKGIEEKLFQPFFTTKEIGKGTGLGLSISKGILDQHNAHFFVNNQFENTCFEIQFPGVPL